MKTIKTVILALFLGVSTCVVAQENKDQIKEELNLSAEQTEKLKEIHEQFKPQFKEIVFDKSLTKDQRDEKMRILREKEREARKGILTPEQIARFEELERKEK